MADFLEEVLLSSTQVLTSSFFILYGPHGHSNFLPPFYILPTVPNFKY